MARPQLPPTSMCLRSGRHCDRSVEMTFNYDKCPLLTDKNIGLSEIGYHWTGSGDVVVDNQTIIDACLECVNDPCWHDCKGMKRREEFGHGH